MKLVTVATYYESTPAWIALNQLKSEGVHAKLENEALLQNVWVLGEAAGQIRLNVAERDSDQAFRIVEQGTTVDLSELNKQALCASEIGLRALE